MSEKRRDNRNRILREGEYQRTDGRYHYRYIDEDGKEKNVYSWRLDKNDPTPKVEPMVDGYAGFLFLDKNDRPMVALHWEKYLQHIVEKYNKIYRI